MDDTAIRLRAVEHAYTTHMGLREHVVLRGIDLDLGRGHTLGLAGPNGSGKSTLLRLLAGLGTPKKGELTVLGGSPTDRGVRRRIGYLPEDSPFPPELTLRGALHLLGALQDMPRKECHARAAELLATVGLAARATTTLGRSSRGMLRRFGLAQAWLHSPDLLLLDEPTAGLDAEGFEVLATLLDEARARNAAVVLASHVVTDLSHSCDEVAVLQDGRIVERGAPAEVLGGRSLLELYRRHDAARAP